MKIKKFFCIFLVCISVTLLSSCGKNEVKANSVFSPDDLIGKHIGAVEGTPAYIRSLELKYENIRVSGYINADLAVEALKAGEVDCLLIDTADADKLISRSSGVAMLEKSIPDEAYGFAVAKENIELTKEINKALEILTQNGIRDDIIQGYTSGGDYRYAHETEEYADTIIIAVDVVGAPYCYDENGILLGLEIDMIHAVCDILNVGIKVKSTDNGNLIVDTQKGRAVFAAGRLDINDEGSELVDFTDVYFTSSQRIIVRK